LHIIKLLPRSGPFGKKLGDGRSYMVGRQISHYKIIEKLGEGGMGEVYLADDLKLDRQVAIKILPEHLTKDKENVERFEREAKAAASLNHPNIITIYEIAEEDDQTFIVMEYVDGESLRIKIDTGVSDLDEILDITKQICDGLSEAHKADIVHRDIKPENILIDNHGRIKILDFGLAKLKGVSKLTKEISTLGTIHYMSPEQVRGEDVDNRSDIWSLGVVLYEMLTGELPFKGDYEQAVMYSIINEQPKRFEDKSSIKPELEQTVKRILQKDPQFRYTTAEDLLCDLADYQKRKASLVPERSVFKLVSRFFTNSRFAIPTVVSIIIIFVFLLWYFNRQTNIRWAKEQALPEIEQLYNELDISAAFNLVKKAEKYISDNPDFREWAEKIETKLTILTDPPGADVYIREYSKYGSDWEKLDKTPIDTIEMPNNSFYLMKMEKSGFENVLAVAATRFDTIYRKLFPTGTIPPGMVYVEGFTNELDDDLLKMKHGFFIDQYEVTNQEYKEFVDAGGYKNKEFWKHEFIKDGKNLTWKEAMAEFIDKTGRPGPANWEASDYPDGQENYPVSGVSWYEAAAYAEYAGKSLPTGDHWDSGAGTYPDYFYHRFCPKMLPFSNFNGKGPEPVGKYRGVNIFGASDMAGNVREWCWNKTEKGRIISGGGWNDAEYLFYSWSQLPPYDRSPENGFRCVLYIDKEKIPESAFRYIKLSSDRDYTKVEPVPENIFRIYKNQFLYDKKDLNSMIEDRDDTPDDWVIERISFNAAYGNERVIAYLYLPKNGKPPFQTLVYFPGIHAIWEEKLTDSRFTKSLIDYLLKNGRAVVYPVYKGTFERNNGLTVRMSNVNQSHKFTEWLIAWTKDFSRSIDYLETRNDIDTTKLGFIGWSWGGEMGGIIPAVENRLKLNILIVGGFAGRAYPEADPINYLPRIKSPVLMLNGKYDPWRPYETNLKPFYELLGTPESEKRLCLYETGHFVPKSEIIKETLNWLDKYFGPVKR